MIHATDDNVYRALRTQLIDEIKDQFDDLQTNNQFLYDQLITELEDVRQNFAAFSSTNEIENNFAQVFEILVRNVLNGGDSFSIGDHDLLEEMAQKCPNIDGRGVRLARKTLNYPPTFSVTCETNRTVSVENQYLGEVTILPVPSSGFMDITCDENIKHVSLLNQNGDVVQSVNGLDKNRIRLNTEEVPTGVYVVQLMLESGGVRTEQVIVSGN